MHTASSSKTEAAYKQIRDGIVDGFFGPGHRLVIDRLAREFGVSQPPVREAIRRLEAEGWVDFTRNVGASVATLDRRGWFETMEVLSRLEAQATAQAAPHTSPDDLRAARAVNGRLSDRLRQMEMVAAQDLNREFHRLLCARCPNGYLIGLVEQAWDRLDATRRAVFVHMPARWSRVTVEHEAIVEAISAGRPPEEIERLARDHKTATSEDLREATGAQDGSPAPIP